MGDRANIIIEPTTSSFLTPVVFYTHWKGSELKGILASALQRGSARWDDPPYLARIIFCEMIKGSETELTGFGISSEIGDNEHPFLCVDMEAMTVKVRPAGRELPDFSSPPLSELSFEAFIEAELARD